MVHGADKHCAILGWKTTWISMAGRANMGIIAAFVVTLLLVTHCRAMRQSGDKM